MIGVDVLVMWLVPEGVDVAAKGSDGVDMLEVT